MGKSVNTDCPNAKVSKRTTWSTNSMPDIRDWKWSIWNEFFFTEDEERSSQSGEYTSVQESLDSTIRKSET